MTVQGTVIFLCSMLLFAINIISNAVVTTPEQESDRRTSLPGQPPVTFSQYSGYVTVNETHGRALFYWLNEAVDNPEKQPLVLWLNGGPGCSSIAYGASEEIGPFRINEDGSSLYLNDDSWNKVANLLFLESPAGVGFSYTNTTSDLSDSGDERTAQDALNFIVRWFARFPQYDHRDFYLAGESYAGYYIPMLAKKIVDYNKANPLSVINFKGLIVGNGVMDLYNDLLGTFQYWYSHAMISDHTYEALIRSCFPNATATEQKSNTSEEIITNSECNDLYRFAFDKEIGNLDHYSIYTPKCLTPSTSKFSRSSLKFTNKFLPRILHASYDSCSVHYAEKYYNNPDVQKALHANTTRISYNWTACSDQLHLHWNYNDQPLSMQDTYTELMGTGLRIWLFSGDTDSIIPVTSTRLSLKQMQLKVKVPWYAWYLDRQVGGWTEVYEGLTFATVRGAGHEVPHIQPERAFTLFKSFIAGENLPALKEDQEKTTSK